jgi:uracil-DNA glycosylase family 4
MADNEELLRVLDEQIVACRRCPRLVAYREKVAHEKRRAFRDWAYWGKPVPGFGDPHARLLILGLAPAAHGGNRTGRVFTGDRSGDFLFRALYKAGFANQPTSVNREDGLRLQGAYVAAAARCAPPDNQPLPIELQNCRSYLERELDILRPAAVLALGKIAWDAYFSLLKAGGTAISRAAHRFGHGAEADIATTGIRLFGVYHPSQQNTQTGRVTLAMYGKVLNRIGIFLNNADRSTLAKSPE